MDLLAARGGAQQAPFRRSVNQAADALEITVGYALLHVDAESIVRRECDQAVSAAMADIETGVCAPSVHHGERLAMLEIAEGKRPIRAAQPLREGDSKCSTAEDELAPCID